MKTPETDLVILNNPVGGGHATFGMDLESWLAGGGIDVAVLDPEQNGGLVERFAWAGIRRTYELGSRGDRLQGAYERIRKNASRGRVLLDIATRSLKKTLKKYPGVVVSTHSYLTSGHPGDYLIHSDAGGDKTMATPADRVVFVPTPQTAQQLVNFGLPEPQVRVVGFTIGKPLYEADPQKPIDHFRQDEPIHAGFFLSGARPRPHVEQIKPLLSKLRPEISGGKVLFTIYTYTDKKLGLDIERFAKEVLNVSTYINDDAAADGKWRGVRIIWGDSQEQAIQRSLDTAIYLDYLFTMPGERLPWVSRIPMFPLRPCINFNCQANYDLGVQLGLFPEKSADPGSALRLELLTKGEGVRRQLELANSVRIPGVDNEGLPVEGAKKIAKELAGVIYEKRKTRP